MNTVLGRFILLVSIAALLTSCDEDTVSPQPLPSPYSSPTEPESLITNLQISYRRREINEYAKLLAPEFIFKFQPIDVDDIGTEFWTRDQDSTGTRALLTTTYVSDIRLSLIYGARDLAVDSTPPVDSLRIRIVTTDLQVDQTDGTTWVAAGQQDMYFRKGIESNGENPDHWWLYEWDDLPAISSPGLSGPATVSWGNLKNRYRL